jgi:hypothetical protein
MPHISYHAILAWFHRAKWGVNAFENREIHTNCPKCGYVNFFFNVDKLVGHCHKAQCEYHLNSPILEDLEELAGFGPDQFGGYRVGVDEPNPTQNVPEVTLPGVPVVYPEDGILMTRFRDVIEYLYNRRLEISDIARFNLHWDGTRVYVPIYDGEKLVNYVGRDLSGQEHKKYLYCHGAKTSDYLFGWDECKNWNRLTLVENTFVSISFRNEINCTTNFGSHLSDRQITLISQSKVQTVAILWDENTQRAARKAVKKLGDHGKRACYAIIPGQPDDHSPKLIHQIANDCHEAALEGRGYIDPWELAQVKLRKEKHDRQQRKRKEQ